MCFFLWRSSRTAAADANDPLVNPARNIPVDLICSFLLRSPYFPNRPRLVIGFAAETENLVRFAVTKRVHKGADWIVANDVSEDGVMGGAQNHVHLITSAGVDEWPRMDKSEIARKLVARIAETLAAK